MPCIEHQVAVLKSESSYRIYCRYPATIGFMALKVYVVLQRHFDYRLLTNTIGCLLLSTQKYMPSGSKIISLVMCCKTGCLLFVIVNNCHSFCHFCEAYSLRISFKNAFQIKDSHSCMARLFCQSEYRKNNFLLQGYFNDLCVPRPLLFPFPAKIHIPIFEAN